MSNSTGPSSNGKDVSSKTHQDVVKTAKRIERLTEELARLRGSTEEKLVRLFTELPIGKVPEVADFFYWEYRNLSGAVKKAVKFVTGRGFDPRPTGRPAVCPACGKEGTAPFFSWCEIDSSDKGGDRLEKTCTSCKERAEQEWKTHTAAWQEKRRREDEEVCRLKNLPYKEYLQTDHWKETRKGAFRRAGFRCQLCNAGKTRLNVHHRTYENRGEELPHDVIVLCQACHEKHHDVLPKEGEGARQ